MWKCRGVEEDKKKLGFLFVCLFFFNVIAIELMMRRIVNKFWNRFEYTKFLEQSNSMARAFDLKPFPKRLIFILIFHSYFYFRRGFKKSSIFGPNLILLGHFKVAYFRYPWGINPGIDAGLRKTEPGQSVWVESQWTNVPVWQEATCAWLIPAVQFDIIETGIGDFNLGQGRPCIW